MRALFAAVIGTVMLIGVATPTAPVLWPLAIGAALVTAAGAWWVAWPWIVGKSQIDVLIADALDNPDGESGYPQGLSSRNTWIHSPDDHGFVAAGTAEGRQSPADEPTVVLAAGLFDMRLRRPRGAHRAGIR